MAKKGSKSGKTKGGYNTNSNNARTISGSGGYFGKFNKSAAWKGGKSSDMGEINAALQKAAEMAAASYPGYVEAASGYEEHYNKAGKKTGNHDKKTIDPMTGKVMPGGSAFDYGLFNPFSMNQFGEVDPDTGTLIDNGSYPSTIPPYRSYDQRVFDMMATFNPKLAEKMRFGTDWSMPDNMHIDLRGGEDGKDLEGREYKGGDYSARTQLDTIAKQQMLNNQLHPEDMNSLLDPTMSVEMDANYAPNISSDTKWKANDGEFNGMPGLFAGGLDMLSPNNVTNYEPGRAAYPANNQPGGFNGFGTLDRLQQPQKPGVISKLQDLARKYDPISGVITTTNKIGDLLSDVFSPFAKPQVQAPQSPPEAELPGPAISPVQKGFTQPAHPQTFTPPSAYYNPVHHIQRPHTPTPASAYGGFTQPAHPPSTGKMPGYSSTAGFNPFGFQEGKNGNISQSIADSFAVQTAKPSFSNLVKSFGDLTPDHPSIPSIGDTEPGLYATSKLYTNAGLGALDPAQVTTYSPVKTLNPAYTQAMKAYNDKATFNPFNPTADVAGALDSYGGIVDPGADPFGAAFSPFGPPLSAKVKAPAPPKNLPPKYITKQVPMPPPKPQFASVGTPNYTGNGAAGLMAQMNADNASVMNSAKAFGYSPPTTLGSILGSMFGGSPYGGFTSSTSKAYGNTNYGTQSIGGNGKTSLGGGDMHTAL
jgi:hypothetical protein